MAFNFKLFILLTFIISTNSIAQNKSSDILATIGSKTISLQEFQKKYDQIKNQALNPPSKEQFLEELIRYEMGLLEADKRNLKEDPIIQDRMRQELYKGFLERELGASVQTIQISDKEMKDWYSKNPEILTSHILIEHKVNASQEQIAEAKKRAEEILTEVTKSKRPFEELVKLYSDDTLTKSTGGSVGWQTRVGLYPTYYEFSAQLKAGEIKGLVKTPFGFHIIKFLGKKSYGDADKRQIRAAVFDAKRLNLFNTFFEKLKNNYPVKINKSLL